MATIYTALVLLSKFFIQPKALVFGKTEVEVHEELSSCSSEMKSKVLEVDMLSNWIIFLLIEHLQHPLKGYVRHRRQTKELNE